MGALAVDLDGTLAHYDEWKGIEHIGDPIPSVLARVKQALAEGREVVIFTARLAEKGAEAYVREWLKKVGLPDLRITNVKDREMEEFWDDRNGPRVEKNKGFVETEVKKKAAQAEAEIQRLLLSIIKDSPYTDKVWSVGGYVRDEILGKQSKDLDLVIEQDGGAKDLAQYLKDQFPKSISTPHNLGQSYPIWHIDFKDDIDLGGQHFAAAGGSVDIADTQKESFTDATSRQRVTTFGTFAEDALRRDLTINTLYRSLTDGEVADPTGHGLEDLKNKVVRGNPDVDFNKILSDDPLRMLRLIRFAVREDGWTVPDEVKEAVTNNAARIEIISGERIREELSKLMQVGKLAEAIEFMKETGLLKYVLPEVQALIGVEQGKKHHAEGDVYNHTILVLRKAEPTIHAQLAALLHDLGKPATQEMLEDKISFLGHEEVSGEIAEAIMRRLAFPNDTISHVRKVVESHMRTMGSETMGMRGVRKPIRELGDVLEDVLKLNEADIGGSYDESGKPKDPWKVRDLRKKIEEAKAVPVEKKSPLNGDEIMALTGLPPGPGIGAVQKMITELSDVLAEEKMQELQEKTPQMTQEEVDEAVKEIQQFIKDKAAETVKNLSKEELAKMQKEYLEKHASVIDYPHPGLDPLVWGQDNTLLPEHKDKVLGKLMAFFRSPDSGFKSDPDEWITDIFILGSLTTYQYNSRTDIDVHCHVSLERLRDAEGWEQESWDMLVEKMDAVRKSLNDDSKEMLQGTSHPIEYFFENYTGKAGDDKAQRLYYTKAFAPEGLYDLKADTWLQPPRTVDADFDPEQMMPPATVKEIVTLMRELDTTIGDIERNIRNIEGLLDVIRSWPPEQQKRFQERISSKAVELDNDIIKYVANVQAIIDRRHKEYKPMADSNLIFKALQKFTYMTLKRDMENLIKDTARNTVEKLPDLKKVLDTKEEPIAKVDVPRDTPQHVSAVEEAMVVSGSLSLIALRYFIKPNGEEIELPPDQSHLDWYMDATAPRDANGEVTRDENGHAVGGQTLRHAWQEGWIQVSDSNVSLEDYMNTPSNLLVQALKFAAMMNRDVTVFDRASGTAFLLPRNEILGVDEDVEEGKERPADKPKVVSDAALDLLIVDWEAHPEKYKKPFVTSAGDLFFGGLYKVALKPAFYLTDSHAQMIWKGQKKLIVKARMFKRFIGEERYLASRERVYGIIVLEPPKVIPLDEFDQYYKDHLVTHEERTRWWPDSTEFYLYPFTFHPFRIPKGWTELTIDEQKEKEKLEHERQQALKEKREAEKAAEKAEQEPQGKPKEERDQQGATNTRAKPGSIQDHINAIGTGVQRNGNPHGGLTFADLAIKGMDESTVTPLTDEQVEKLSTDDLEQYIDMAYEKGAPQAELDWLETLWDSRVTEEEQDVVEHVLDEGEGEMSLQDVNPQMQQGTDYEGHDLEEALIRFYSQWIKPQAERHQEMDNEALLNNIREEIWIKQVTTGNKPTGRVQGATVILDAAKDAYEARLKHVDRAKAKVTAPPTKGFFQGILRVLRGMVGMEKDKVRSFGSLPIKVGEDRHEGHVADMKQWYGVDVEAVGKMVQYRHILPLSVKPIVGTDAPKSGTDEPSLPHSAPSVPHSDYRYGHEEDPVQTELDGVLATYRDESVTFCPVCASMGLSQCITDMGIQGIEPANMTDDELRHIQSKHTGLRLNVVATRSRALTSENFSDGTKKALNLPLRAGDGPSFAVSAPDGVGQGAEDTQRTSPTVDKRHFPYDAPPDVKGLAGNHAEKAPWVRKMLRLIRRWRGAGGSPTTHKNMSGPWSGYQNVDKSTDNGLYMGDGTQEDGHNRWHSVHQYSTPNDLGTPGTFSSLRLPLKPGNTLIDILPNAGAVGGEGQKA